MTKVYACANPVEKRFIECNATTAEYAQVNTIHWRLCLINGNNAIKEANNGPEANSQFDNKQPEHRWPDRVQGMGRSLEIYTGDRLPKSVLFIYESDDHYYYAAQDIIESIKSYGEPTEASVNHASRIVKIDTHFMKLMITFARWHQYDRIVSLHNMDYVVIYLPRCETFLKRLLIVTMP